MFEIDPRDRPQYLSRPRRRIRAVVLTIFAIGIILGAGAAYWQISSSFSQVYKRLNIASLPLTLELQPRFYTLLNQLSREPCYRDAVTELSDALLDSGYPRESATSLLAYASRCGDTNNDLILIKAYAGFEKINDYSDALQIANQLVISDPVNPQYRYWRGGTFEDLKNFSEALRDYIAALQLMGAPNEIDGGQFYDISRMYAALGRYCDAIAPIETFISFNPAARRTPQTTKLISEYAEKGSCDAHYARGVAHVPLLNVVGVHALAVVVNSVAGNFILDTGAEIVAITPNFAARAKVAIETANQLPMKTAGGFATADLGYANTISVGNAEANGVAVAVIQGANDPFGSNFDGLLGMSFLARFSLHIAPDGIELAAIPLR